MLKYLLSIFLIVNVLNVSAQINKYFDDIKNSFDKNSQNELTKISKALNSAQKEFDEGEKLNDSGDFSKALEKVKKTASVFKENYKKLFMIYENKLTPFINEADGKQKVYFEKKMQEAKNNLRISIYKRLKAGEEKEDKTVYELLKTSHQNETASIDNLSTVFALINGWETSDYVIEETNYNPNEIFENTNTENFNIRSFSVNDPFLENSYKFNHQIIFENNNGAISSNYTNNSNNNNFYNYNQKNTSLKGSAKHEFRIQIGTSILPANNSQLKRLNKTNLPVSVYKSTIYYKYTVGSFANFQEAKNFKNAYGLTNVYITEYNKGKEVKFYMKDFQ